MQIINPINIFANPLLLLGVFFKQNLNHKVLGVQIYQWVGFIIFSSYYELLFYSLVVFAKYALWTAVAGYGQ